MTKSSSNDVMVFLSLFRERTLVNFTICGAAPDHDCFYDFEANVLNLSTAFQERQDWKRWLLHELAHILARQGRTRPVRDLELANLCVAAANDDPGSRIELIANTFEFCMTVMKQRWYEPSVDHCKKARKCWTALCSCSREGHKRIWKWIEEYRKAVEQAFDEFPLGMHDVRWQEEALKLAADYGIQPEPIGFEEQPWEEVF